MNKEKLSFSELMKKYAYYVVVFFSLVILTAIITIVGIATTRSNTLPTNSQALVYTSPILNGNILKDYSNTELQWNKTLGQWEVHKALDFVANSGANVYSFTDGTVEKVYTNQLDGTCVTIKHSDELSTIYKFLDSNLEIKEGDIVKSGQVIGKVSGNAGVEGEDGSHLHFEVWKNGSSVDPSSYLDISNK